MSKIKIDMAVIIVPERWPKEHTVNGDAVSLQCE